MKRVEISVRIDIDETTYEFRESEEVDTQEWDIEGVAVQSLDMLMFRMKSAIQPCFYDHSIAVIKREGDQSDNSN